MNKKIEEKKRIKGRVGKDTYWKGEGELLEDRAYDYGCNSETPLRDAVGSFRKKKNSSAYGTVYYLNRDSPVPNCLNSYAPPNAGRPSIQWAGGIGQFISPDSSTLTTRTRANVGWILIPKPQRNTNCG